MTSNPSTRQGRLAGHALRNANLRERSVRRAQEAPPLARALVNLRARVLGMTRLELARQSGISRGTLRDVELGIHIPTRRILQQFVDFCQARGVASHYLDEISTLYAGTEGGLGPLIARLELRAGSSAELARQAGISPGTLWEYRRGHFPLPLGILHRLCQAVGEDPTLAETIWHEAERQRFLARGYPLPLAELWTLCSRQDYTEKHLLSLGLSTGALRQLRYLELPAWEDVAEVARILCRDDQEWRSLQQLWQQEQKSRKQGPGDRFGLLLQDLRKRKGLSRRDVADLFRIGGKKPAQLIQSIEEEGCYSAQAYPAGFAALVACGPDDQAQMVELWKERRERFHRRHRPETRIDLRLARELYGFEYKDMEAILGYPSLEYQKIERGVSPLHDTARDRILRALHQAGQQRIERLLQCRDKRNVKRTAWRSPPSVKVLISLLADREGGLIPLTRHLRQAGVTGCWAGRLRSIAQGSEVPPWPLLKKIGQVCGVPDLTLVQSDWQELYRRRLEEGGSSPLGAEVRLLIAEVAMTLREFSSRLDFSPSVLVRDLQRLDRGKAVKWFHVERILLAAKVAPHDRRWEQIHAWWYATRHND